MSKTYTLKESATFLGVSYRTIRRYLKNGLPYSETKGDKGIEYRLSEADLVAFKKARFERPKQGASLQEIYASTNPNSPEQDQKEYERTERTEGTKMRPASTADSLSRQMIENLESENAFLKQQIAFKDKELSDCHDLIKKLTHQNEVLTQIRQSVEPNLPLDGEAAQQEPAIPAIQDPDGETLATDQPLSKTEIIAEAKRLHREGKSAEDIRQFVVRCGYDSFSDLLKKQKQDQKKTL